MNLIPNAIRSMFNAAPAPRRVVVKASRAQKAADGIRMMNMHKPSTTNDMERLSGSIDQLVHTDLIPTREKARKQWLENDYVQAYVRSVEQNVVGKGIGMENDARLPDGTSNVALNKVVNAAWKEWCKKENCDVRGKSNFRGLTKLTVKTTVVDGESIIRMRSNYAKSKHNFALQILSTDLFDPEYDVPKNNIRCGIEYDIDDRPVTYFFRQRPGTEGAFRWLKNGKWYTGIPAAEILHIFVEDYPDQSRGFPWFASSMTRLHQLAAFEEAELIATRVSAGKMGLLKPPPAEDIDPQTHEPETDEDGNVIEWEPEPPMQMEVTPGSFGTLPPGYEMAEWNPQHPNGNYSDFRKGILRGVAAGTGMGYPDLASDLESVNLSSMRGGMVQVREKHQADQQLFEDDYLIPVFDAWFKCALLSGAFHPYRFSELKGNINPKFMFRGWPMHDPNKDWQSSILANQHGMKSKTEIVAEQGKSLRDIVVQMKADQDLYKEFGVELVDAAVASVKPTPAVEKAPAKHKNDDEDDEEDDDVDDEKDVDEKDDKKE